LSTSLFPVGHFELFLHYILTGIAHFPIQCLITVAALWIWIRIVRGVRRDIDWRRVPVTIIGYERPDPLLNPATALALPPADSAILHPDIEQVYTKDDAEAAQDASAKAIAAIRDTSLEVGLIEQTLSGLTAQDRALLQRQLDKARRLIAEAFAAYDEIMDNPWFDPSRYTGYEYIAKAWLRIETLAYRARAALDFALGLTEQVELG